MFFVKTPKRSSWEMSGAQVVELLRMLPVPEYVRSKMLARVVDDIWERQWATRSVEESGLAGSGDSLETMLEGLALRFRPPLSLADMLEAEPSLSPYSLSAARKVLAAVCFEHYPVHRALYPPPSWLIVADCLSARASVARGVWSLVRRVNLARPRCGEAMELLEQLAGEWKTVTLSEVYGGSCTNGRVRDVVCFTDCELEGAIAATEVLREAQPWITSLYIVPKGRSFPEPSWCHEHRVQGLLSSELCMHATLMARSGLRNLVKSPGTRRNEHLSIVLGTGSGNPPEPSERGESGRRP